MIPDDIKTALESDDEDLLDQLINRELIRLVREDPDFIKQEEEHYNRLINGDGSEPNLKGILK